MIGQCAQGASHFVLRERITAEYAEDASEKWITTVSFDL